MTTKDKRMNENWLPTFLCIGAMKSGTSSLHRYLDGHPDIRMSYPKETDFFLDRNAKSLDWYQGCFENEAVAYGEVSPNYSKYPGFDGVPERMHKLLPDIRLIYLVRDPIDRAVSHYVHNWEKRRINDSIDDALNPPEDSWYINTSRYYFQLSQYLDYYPIERILIVESEQLRGERARVLSEIFEFIGVNPNLESDTPDREYNTGMRRPTKLADFLIRSSIGKVVKDAGKSVVPESAIEYVKQHIWSDAKKPEPKRETINQVKNYLKEDVQKLRNLTGKSFDSWSL